MTMTMTMNMNTTKHSNAHRRHHYNNKATMMIILLMVLLATSSLLCSSSSTTTFVVNGFDLNRKHHNHRHVVVSGPSTASLGRQRRVDNHFKLLTTSTSIEEFDDSDNTAISRLLSSSIISIRGGSSSSSSSSEAAASLQQPPSIKKRNRQLVPIGVALIIGSFSILEILESLREETERYFGHAHGILILSLIRLFRSIAILQTNVVEFEEATEKLFNKNEDDDEEDEKEEETKKKKRLSLSSLIGKFIVSRRVSIIACIMASIASLVEVYDDLKPGGHHGAVFLALSELNYQLNRCHDIRTPITIKNGKTNQPSSLLTWKRFVGPTLFVAAAVFAAYELYEDLKPGAHHAVAVLALAELVENINRSKVLKKMNNNGGKLLLRKYIFFGPKKVRTYE
jgi:hypothetical protein